MSTMPESNEYGSEQWALGKLHSLKENLVSLKKYLKSDSLANLEACIHLVLCHWSVVNHDNFKNHDAIIDQRQQFETILVEHFELIREAVMTRVDIQDRDSRLGDLDRVLEAAGSQQAGQFMAPILVRRRLQAIAAAAKVLADLLDLNDLPPVVARRLLLVFEKVLIPGQELMPDVSEKTRTACLNQRCRNLRASLLAWE